MRPFWRSFWASILAYFSIATFLTLIILIFVWAFSGEEETMEDNTVLHMKLDFKVNETSSLSTLSSSTSLFNIEIGLREIKEALALAKKDSKVEGIYLNIGSAKMGNATIEELRTALEDFKESGKFVYAYNENYTQKGYYASLAADKLYLNPGGRVDFRGMSREVVFIKGLLDKLEVDMQVIRGSNNKFKAAVEPLIIDSLSPSNKEQLLAYTNTIWGNMLDDMSQKRGISVDDLNLIADSALVRNAETSKQYKLVDEVIYFDQFEDIIAAEAGNDFNVMSFKKYLLKNTFNLAEKKQAEKKGNIAVIYASGEIKDGKGGPNLIGGETFRQCIHDVREDDDIKAVVLRINSPGGSALASDIMWRELEICDKPIIVSMGNYAASGGYYIACNADRIFAHPNTLTGSIGVFGIIPNLGPMLENVGITTDHIETNEHANFSLMNALTDEELEFVQEGVDEIYDNFISKVASGRQMSKAQVDAIGQGRIWSGTQALENGLVDELGDLQDAINYAAKQAELSEIKVSNYPKWADDEFGEMILDLLLNSNIARAEMLQKSNKSSLLDQISEQVKLVEELHAKGAFNYQARLPFEFMIAE